MEQQLLTKIIQIGNPCRYTVPSNMDQLLDKIQTDIANQSDNSQLMTNVVKALFYGLWNFDKMINQHNLNTKISELLHKLPKKASLTFFTTLIEYLQEKWTLIDHHRINKFMQLVRYLLFQSFKLEEKIKGVIKKIEKIILEKVFMSTNLHNGLAQHITDVYFQVMKEAQGKSPSLKDLSIFETVLKSHSNEAFRLYICSHIYQRLKKDIFERNEQNVEILEKQLLELSQHFLQIAKKEEKDLYRKNFYNLVGYCKSAELSFDHYLDQKQRKLKAQQEKKKKKITKGKKQEIKKLRQNRKGRKEKQGKKIKKVMSVRKFEDKNRMKKGIEEL